VEIEILHPDKLTGNWNNDSLAMKLTYKKVSFLFVADLGQKVCDGLVEHYKEKLKCTVLKVPYHGKAGGGEFIRKASPEVAVLSVGPSIWGAPSEEILAEYKDSKIPLLRTDEKGTIVIKTDGEKIWL
jgi:competence protein ComEC